MAGENPSNFCLLFFTPFQKSMGKKVGRCRCGFCSHPVKRNTLDHEVKLVFDAHGRHCSCFGGDNQSAFPFLRHSERTSASLAETTASFSQWPYRVLLFAPKNACQCSLFPESSLGLFCSSPFSSPRISVNTDTGNSIVLCMIGAIHRQMSCLRRTAVFLFHPSRYFIGILVVFQTVNDVYPHIIVLLNLFPLKFGHPLPQPCFLREPLLGRTCHSSYSPALRGISYWGCA